MQQMLQESATVDGLLKQSQASREILANETQKMFVWIILSIDLIDLIWRTLTLLLMPALFMNVCLQWDGYTW